MRSDMAENRSRATFKSPWQRRGFVGLVKVLRWLLHPWPAAENRFIDGLIADQNRRVQTFLQGNPPRTLLLIMPRCVKKTGCRAPVQESLDQCLDCGECALGNVAHLCLDHGVKAVVAFRSHIAFAMARSEKPDLIIASACGDRMIKALRMTPEFPALLTPLSGMHQPCRDAQIDLDWILEQLRASAPETSPGSIRATQLS